MADLQSWAQAGWAFAWSALTIAASWAAGYALRRLLTMGMARWWGADLEGPGGLVLPMIRRRLPMWCVLTGIWLSAGYWPLTADAHALVTRMLFVVGATSVTITAATVASELVVAHGQTVAPGLKVTGLVRNIVTGLIGTLGFLIILNGIGISIAPMLTALGVGGLAVALALQESLANLFAGVFITLAGQIRIGDYIRLDSGQEGYVVDLTWRSTRLRMLSNNLVIVPNAKLAQAVVINHHLPSEDMAVLVEVGVDYGSDLSRVESVVCDVGREVMGSVTGAVLGFEPFVRYHTFDDSSINFTVILRGREFTDQYLIKHEFVKRLHERFRLEGIVIPFPIRTVVHAAADAESSAR